MRIRSAVARAGHGRARALPALPRLDAAGRPGRGGRPGPREERRLGARTARDRGRDGAAAAARGRDPSPRGSAGGERGGAGAADRVFGFAASLVAHPTKVAEAIRYRLGFSGHSLRARDAGYGPPRDGSRSSPSSSRTAGTPGRSAATCWPAPSASSRTSSWRGSWGVEWRVARWPSATGRRRRLKACSPRAKPAASGVRTWPSWRARSPASMPPATLGRRSVLTRRRARLRAFAQPARGRLHPPRGAAAAARPRDPRVSL